MWFLFGISTASITAAISAVALPNRNGALAPAKSHSNPAIMLAISAMSPVAV